jgi:photoactive yellow protein
MTIGSGAGDLPSAQGEVGYTVCAWCNKVLEKGNRLAPVMHAICLSCVVGEYEFPSETIESMNQKQLDRLPFGVIRIAEDGTVLNYNETECEIASRRAADVIGKNFFNEVAPCTRVEEFQGQFLKLQQAGVDGRAKFSFVFKFATGAALVDIVLLYEAASGCGTILVKVVKTEPAGPPHEHAAREIVA